MTQGSWIALLFWNYGLISLTYTVREKGGNFKTRKFFNYPESFLYCLYSRYKGHVETKFPFITKQLVSSKHSYRKCALVISILHTIIHNHNFSSMIAIALLKDVFFTAALKAPKFHLLGSIQEYNGQEIPQVLWWQTKYFLNFKLHYNILLTLVIIQHVKFRENIWLTNSIGADPGPAAPVLSLLSPPGALL